MSGILVMRLRGLGDIVHTLPILQMLRKQNPDELIGLFIQKPLGQLIPSNLNIKLIEMPPRARFAQLLKLSRQIKKYKFDVVYDLFGNPATAIVTALSGIKKRYGFDYRIRKWAYTKTFKPENPNIRLMELFGQFFSFFGVKGKLHNPELNFSDAIMQKAKEALPANLRGIMPLLAINPHTTYMSKAWPREYFIELINLWYDWQKKPVLITWGPGEHEAALSIVKELDGKAFTHEALKINEFAALLKQVDLFLTADTGPMNIAWATDTPVIALFGPTTREPVYPRGTKHLILFNENLDCLECHLSNCIHKTCMYSLKPQLVFDKILNKYSFKKQK